MRLKLREWVLLSLLFCLLYFFFFMDSILTRRVTKKATNQFVHLQMQVQNWHLEEKWRRFQEEPNTIVVLRILSNDLPPLHSSNQSLLNTKYILEKEKLPSGFKRLWVLNSIANKDKEKDLVELLTSHGEVFDKIPLVLGKSVTAMESQALNPNAGRNKGIVRGFRMGAKWVVVFDGCSFVTKESYDTLSTFLNSKTSASFIFHFIPMVRLQHKVQMNSETTYQHSFPYTSGFQECQLAVSRLYLHFRNHVSYFKRQKGFLFDERRAYANANKLQLLVDIKEHLNNRYVHCREAMIGWTSDKSDAASKDQSLISKCGYIIRLPYHPDDRSPIEQILLPLHRVHFRDRAKNNFVKILKNLSHNGTTSKKKLS